MYKLIRTRHNPHSACKSFASPRRKSFLVLFRGQEREKLWDSDLLFEKISCENLWPVKCCVPVQVLKSCVPLLMPPSPLSMDVMAYKVRIIVS